MCLVDNEGRSIGQHRNAFDGVDREQGVIRHDDVRLHRPSPRLGRKTFVTKRAPALAHAFGRRHRYGSPHSRVDLGIEVIPVTGLGVCRPLMNHRRLFFQRSPGPRADLLLRDERLLAVGLTHSLPA